MEVLFGPAVASVERDAEKISDLVNGAVANFSRVLSIRILDGNRGIGGYRLIELEAGSSPRYVFEGRHFTLALAVGIRPANGE